MQHSKKITFVPFERDQNIEDSSELNERGENNTTTEIQQDFRIQGVPLNRNITTNYSNKNKSKLIKQLLLVLKLATVNAYDEKGLIKDEQGISVPNSSVPNLLQLAMNRSSNVVGRNAFVYQCYRAGISPELISEFSLKNQLQNLYLRQNTPVPTTNESGLLNTNIDNNQTFPKQLEHKLEVRKKRKYSFDQPEINIKKKFKEQINKNKLRKPKIKLKFKKLNRKWIIP